MMSEDFAKNFKSLEPILSKFQVHFKEVQTKLSHNLFTCLHKEDFKETIYFIQSIAHIGGLQELIEGYVNNFLPKMLAEFKQLLLLGANHLVNSSIESFKKATELLLLFKKKADDLTTAIRDFLTNLYYINKAMFFIDDYGKYAKEACRRIFSIVFKKVMMIVHENVKRLFDPNQADSPIMQFHILKINAIKGVQRQIKEVLQILVTSAPDLDILLPPQIEELGKVNDHIYAKFAKQMQVVSSKYLGGFRLFLIHMVLNLKDTSTWNIDDEKNEMDVFFNCVDLIKVSRAQLVEGMIEVFEEVQSDAGSILSKVTQSSDEKTSLKKTANIAWNFYHLIWHVRLVVFEYTLRRDHLEKEFNSNLVDLFGNIVKKTLSFLARKTFDSFEVHLKGLSNEMKIGFISFFAENDRRDLFKDLSINLPEKKVSDLEMIIAGLAAKKKPELASKCWTGSMSREKIQELISQFDMQKLNRYLN